ncbi:MAG: cupredoxin domain-containing protein [Candidatus Eiseniibacteriota bacterium]
MNRPRRVTRSAAFLLVAVVALVASCSDKGTNPSGGGGGTKELNSGPINGGGTTFSHTFANAGTYNYFCTIHGAATMSGSVTVANGQPATASVTITNNAYTPANVQVQPGGMVTWTNNGGPHTVTSP